MPSRTLLVAGIVLAAAGCKPRICCDRGDTTGWLATDACEEAGGFEVPRYVCGGVGDPDATDTETDADPTDERLPCEQFCDPMTALCPADTACLESCEHSTTPPTASDIACVEAATTCSDAQPCWGFLTFE
ncbi:MAG: hypothetical protein H6733_09245 [Alphaproteobacteria bacterium]|nr:hypothetical protein [Alphaproteobacteria bacterium]